MLTPCWKTKDGEVFEDKKKAEYHASSLDIKSKIEDMVKTYGKRTVLKLMGFEELAEIDAEDDAGNDGVTIDQIKVGGYVAFDFKESEITAKVIKINKKSFKVAFENTVWRLPKDAKFEFQDKDGEWYKTCSNAYSYPQVIVQTVS